VSTLQPEEKVFFILGRCPKPHLGTCPLTHYGDLFDGKAANAVAFSAHKGLEKSS